MPVKNLYKAKSFKDLENMTEVDPNVAKRSTHALMASADKVFKNAEEKYLDNDEETAYVQYMRFIELVLLLKKKSDFSQQVNTKKLLERANTALSKAGNLKKSLEKRYSVLQAASEVDEKNVRVSTVSKITSETAANIPIKILEDKEKLSISSIELYSLLTTSTSLIIIMDVRPKNDFIVSHIKHSHCISVPEEILKPGIIAAIIESDLTKESLVHWFKRKDADYIVLVDWDSENESSQNIYLNSLKAALCKWDNTCVLKKTPMVLKGGYKDWMQKYPMYTTQVLDFNLMSNVKISPVTTDLSGIEYPNLDESVNDEIQLINEKNSNDLLFKKSSVPVTIINGTSPTLEYPGGKKPISAPPVNRKSKPIVDVTIKPLSADVKSSKNLNHSANNRKSENSIPEKNIPPVDRRLKSSLLTEKDSSIKDSVLESFNKEQVLTKESVEILNKKLISEEEFEKLCLRKELEAEESKRIEIQKQEEILLKKLQHLKIQSEEKDAELLKVKEENQKIKKLLDEKIDRQYKMETEKEIDAMKKTQAALQENVEKLREERKRKEAENLRKREVHPSVPRESASANSVLRKVDKNDKPAFQVTPANTPDYIVPLSRENSDSSNRGLVRSHSSPNIAQMLNEEESVQHKMPSVDRSLKPKVTVNSHFGEVNRARIRNLNPLYGNCPARAATGLRNLGNTCFMNSVIQCLSNTLPLAEYINSGQYVEHINRENKQGTGGELVEEFAVVIKSLWMGQYKSFCPKDFKNTVSKCLSVCIGNEQQDSHEFLVVLMEKLHADLNRKYVKNVPKLASNCSEIEFWEHHKTYNSSKISDIFDGLLKSTLTCLSCQKTSDNFEVFSCLSLPILTSKCTLRECFQHFLRAEKISGEAAWDCPRCKQKKEAEKRLRICRVPEVFVIQLKRFSYEGLWRRKLQTHVDFDFNLEVPYEMNSHEYFRTYSLYGIVNHYGTLEGGHYTAYCKTSAGKWMKYDDHEVSEINSSDIRTSAAYLLFYISNDFQSRL